MGYRRFCTDIMESTTELTFALVVRIQETQETLGGGYVTVIKPPTIPLTDALLEKALDDAVALIVRKGNDALPRDKARIRAEYALKPKEDTGVGRVLREMARVKDNADRGQP